MSKAIVHITELSIVDKKMFLEYKVYLNYGEIFNGNLSISFPDTALEVNNNIKSEILKSILNVSKKTLTNLDIIIFGGAV